MGFVNIIFDQISPTQHLPQDSERMGMKLVVINNDSQVIVDGCMGYFFCELLNLTRSLSFGYMTPDSIWTKSSIFGFSMAIGSDTVKNE